MVVPTVEEALKGETIIMLATVESNQPRVRPVTLIEHKGALYVLTGSSDAKTKQIQENQKVEVLKLVPHENLTGYIRFSAIAKIIKDPKTREHLANVSSFFYNYWESSENPKYALLQLIPQKIEYMKPGQQEPDPVKKFKFTK